MQMFVNVEKPELMLGIKEPVIPELELSGLKEDLMQKEIPSGGDLSKLTSRLLHQFP